MMGMSASWLHHHHKDYDFTQGQFRNEIIATTILILVSTISASPSEYSYLPPPVLFFWAILSRPLFCASIAYMMLMMISKGCSELPAYRPSRILQWFFSARVWIPIAYLSYLVYLIHIKFVGFQPMNLIPPTGNGVYHSQYVGCF